MSIPEQRDTLEVLRDFLAADHQSPYYSARDALLPAYTVLADILEPEEILYVWPEVSDDTTGSEAGVLHVITPRLHVSAAYKRDEVSTARLRPLSINGLDVAPVYREQFGQTYLMRYTLTILRDGEHQPLRLTATYSTNETLTTKLREAFVALRATLGNRTN